MDVGGAVPGDGFAGADVVIVGSADGDLLDEFEGVLDLFAEQPPVFHRPEAAFGAVTIFTLPFKVDIARDSMLMTFPLGLAVLLFRRSLWWPWLIAKRPQGAFSDRALLLGSLDALPEREAECGATTLIVTSSDELLPQRIREISWRLEPRRRQLVMTLALTDIGGPRVYTRPVAGWPLVRIETPSYERPKAFWKRAFDVAGLGVLILLLSPLLLVLAEIGRLQPPRLVLFRQDREGYQGTPLPVREFRSTVVDDEQRRAQLLEAGTARGAGKDVLFKMKDDPRLTRVGRVLRRFSLDELPPPFKVFADQMWLVEPRSPLPCEVEQYESHVHRKFLVKPGLTGLWPVSARSSLTWEDLRCDWICTTWRNWSVIGDLQVLWRTFKAVVGKDGAY